MTEWMMQSTERDLSRLLGDYLQRRTASAKDLARRIDCDPRTAEGFRAGRYWPQARHWLGLVYAFGEDLTDAVFHPEKAAARLEREVSDLEKLLADRRKAADAARRHAARLAQIGRRPAPAAKDRAAEILTRTDAP